MRTAILILKWVSQVIIVAVGVAGIWRTHREEKNGKRRLKVLGWISIAGLVVGFLLFVITDIHQRNEMSNLIKANRNREITGMQISYTPSSEEWSRIEAAFETIPRFVAEIPNSAAGMTAERNANHWKIVFDEVRRTEGTVKFPPLLSNDPKGKPFVDVINVALPALWIKWAPNVETDIESKGYLYPSAIYISKDKIALTLRPPELRLKLNDMDRDFAILVRSDRTPAKLRFLSLDENVTLDQTVTMQWKTNTEGAQTAKEDLIKRTRPNFSGPHKLQVTLKT